MADPNLRYNVFRSEQLIVPFGVGSIVDLPDESVMPASIDLWADNLASQKLYDPRLQERLRSFNITHFRKVPNSLEYESGIPFVRFPKWLYCKNPRCGRLKHISEWRKLYKRHRGKESKIPRCYKCNIKLVPSRFIIVCEHGHIDDFPWENWVHNKKKCEKLELRIKTSGSQSGLGGILISCDSCGAKRSMAGAFNKDVHKCTGNKPWKKEKDRECTARANTLQRTASNVYFPKVMSSLLIPPFSNKKIQEIQQDPNWDVINSASLPEEMMTDFKKHTAKNHNIELADLERMIQMVNNATTADSENEYRFEEYQALLGNFDKEDRRAKDFIIEKESISGDEIPGLENLVLVHSVKELRTLVSFSRINPLDKDEFGTGENSDTKACPVKEDENTKYLPAIEVKGEGIFLTFNSKATEDWESENPEVKNRAKKLTERLNQMGLARGLSERMITPKFILLHTLAHLLIRELSYECGYAAASLRERIYCDESNDDPSMTGLLIYTSSGDSEGTLGGLVRQGKTELFYPIFKRAIQRAYWCSSDPLCMESEGQGMGSLNLAACHACSLLPETSCEEFNRLLDRAVLVGNDELDVKGFFDSLLSETVEN